jgi:hypothetical protein
MEKLAILCALVEENKSRTGMYNCEMEEDYCLIYSTASTVGVW